MRRHEVAERRPKWRKGVGCSLVVGGVMGGGWGCAPELNRSEGVVIRFVEVAKEVGLAFEHHHREGELDYICESMGSGLAWLDYDRDGDWDLFVVNGPGGHHALFRNEGGRFTDVAARAGIREPRGGMGVAAADYDNDGWVDFLVTAFEEPMALYRNRGDGTFENVAKAVGLDRGAPYGWTTGAAWGDVDNDGNLDLYVVRYVDFTNPDTSHLLTAGGRPELFTLVPDCYPPQRNDLYRNNGNGTFSEISEQAGVADPGGRGLGAMFADYDGDGDLDLYVCNDNTPNKFFRNRGDGTFEDISFLTGTEDTRGSMGVDSGDYDNDGDLDLVVTNWQTETNALYRNNRIPSKGRKPSDAFDDVTLDVGLGAPSLGLTGWGVHFADFDSDGDLDLYIANGYTSPSGTDKYRCDGQRSLLLRNDGGKFSEVPDAFAFSDWGAGRGSALADFDGDGDLDVAVSQNNGRLLLFRNDTPSSTKGVFVEAPIGTHVEARAGNRHWIGTIAGGSSYLSTNAPQFRIAVPEKKFLDRIGVRFSDGTFQIAKRVPGGHRVVFAPHVPPTVK